MLSKDVNAALGYFSTEVAIRYPDVSATTLVETEKELGSLFPPSYREFLLKYNGMSLPDYRLLSISPVKQEGTIVDETMDLRARCQQNGLRGSDRWITICRDCFGCVFVLLPEYADGTGECPVAWIDVDDVRNRRIVASSFERFLWFLLDRLKRRFQPNGEDKERRRGILPWPFGDEEWINEKDRSLQTVREMIERTSR